MKLNAKKTSKIQTNEPNTNGYGDFQPQQQTTNYQTSSINFDDTYNPSNQNFATAQQQQSANYYDNSANYYDQNLNYYDQGANYNYNSPQANYYDPNANLTNQQKNTSTTQNYYQPQAPLIQATAQQIPQQQHGNMFIPNNLATNLVNDPMAAMAVNYGSALADKGKEYVSKNVDKWFSISKLKYYFAVDTSYVARKLFLLLLPFFNRDWSVKYDQNEPVPPKLDCNAPDMYIPVMAFVTYILTVGIVLGTNEKFTPELLGINASSALGWFLIEVFLIYIFLQILNVKSSLKTFDIMAFCGYKYFGMILCLIANLLISSNAYTIVLIYMCISLTYFMVRNLKLLILSETGQNEYEVNNTQGSKRRIYLLLFISLLQPLFMWWLTRHLV